MAGLHSCHPLLNRARQWPRAENLAEAQGQLKEQLDLLAEDVGMVHMDRGDISLDGGFCEVKGKYAVWYERYGDMPAGVSPKDFLKTAKFLLAARNFAYEPAYRDSDGDSGGLAMDFSVNHLGDMTIAAYRDGSAEVYGVSWDCFRKEGRAATVSEPTCEVRRAHSRKGVRGCARSIERRVSVRDREPATQPNPR